MRSIKIIINGANKFKMKVSSKKAKDIRISCPDEFVSDTITLFQNPEKLVLTEQNVAYLAGICETHKQVLNLKPIFLKRISNLQSEIDSILHLETQSSSGEGDTKSDSEAPSATPLDREDKNKLDDFSGIECEAREMGERSANELIQRNSVNTNEDIFSILEDAEKMVNQELKSYSELAANHNIREKSTTNMIINNECGKNESSEWTSSHNNKNLVTVDDLKPLPVTGESLTSVSDPSNSISLRKETTTVKEESTEEGKTSRSIVSAKEDTRVTVSNEGDTTIVRGVRQREVVATRTTYERDPKLFVRIVSPKQRIITRYTSYSPEVNSPPVFAADCVGEAARNLMSS